MNSGNAAAQSSGQSAPRSLASPLDPRATLQAVSDHKTFTLRRVMVAAFTVIGAIAGGGISATPLVIAGIPAMAAFMMGTVPFGVIGAGVGYGLSRIAEWGQKRAADGLQTPSHHHYEEPEIGEEGGMPGGNENIQEEATGFHVE